MNGDHQTPASGGGNKGTLVGAIIVILLLVVGALYFLSAKSAPPAAPAGQPETAPLPLTEPTPAEELQNIENETSNLNSEVEVLEQELGNLAPEPKI